MLDDQMEVEVEEVETEEVSEEIEEIEEDTDEVEADETDISEQDEQDDDDDTAEEDEESGALTVTIEGEEPEEEDPSEGIRSLRQAYKDLKEENKSLREKTSKYEKPQSEVGEKPTMESCDYDEERFEQELLSWKDRKAAEESQQEEQRKKMEKIDQRFIQRRETYNDSKRTLGVKDFDDAEERVNAKLTETRQNLLVYLADKPEIVTYALGKNSKALDKLVSAPDDYTFTYELAKLEKSMNVTRTAKPKPEKRLKGGKGIPLSSDSKLEKLEAEADRTGDRTKVLAFKRELARNRK